MTLKILPHRKSDPPTSASPCRPRAAPCRGSGPLTSGRRPRLGVSCLAGTRTGTPTTYFPFTRGHGAATSQWPRRQKLNPVAQLRCGRRLGAGDGPALRRNRRGVGARTARRGLPLLAIAGPAQRSLRSSRTRDNNVALRRAREDSVETGHHPLRVVAAIIALVATVLVGRILLRLPLLPGLRPTCLQRLSLEILLIFLLLF